MVHRKTHSGCGSNIKGPLVCGPLSPGTGASDGARIGDLRRVRRWECQANSKRLPIFYRRERQLFRPKWGEPAVEEKPLAERKRAAPIGFRSLPSQLVSSAI